eukprot:CAMPEP_0174818626 /NCGR_PEP_ID=MMETSP1107-20130205/1418_1 /TAXON_ID=36770 /ORGANISM="Paraphysomonas vestita, Strain GFlagA" /LENGTH=202 /DNA_ID=CAMNT_0016030767 /DNA_START=445 /DNA_END=1053 /DNA_ORIENTATION=-
MKAFGGGGSNQVKCATCQRTVYPNDPQITLDGVAYHKECAKCIDCNCQITLANFCKFGTTLYCKTHYFKHFKEEGGYLGDDKYSHKSSSGAYIPKESSFVPKADGSNSNSTTTNTNEQSETIPNLESISITETTETTEVPVEQVVESTNESTSVTEPEPEPEVTSNVTETSNETKGQSDGTTNADAATSSSTTEEVNDTEGV